MELPKIILTGKALAAYRVLVMKEYREELRLARMAQLRNPVKYSTTTRGAANLRIVTARKQDG